LVLRLLSFEGDGTYGGFMVRLTNGGSMGKAIVTHGIRGETGVSGF